MFLTQCICGETFPTDKINCPKCDTPEHFCEPAYVDPKYWGYDIESFPNIFTCTFIRVCDGKRVFFEISDRRNDIDAFVDFCYWLGRERCVGVGYNNLGFDYPVIHAIMEHGAYSYDHTMRILEAGNENNRKYLVWEDQRVFKQLDLMKVHHFDNKAKMTSLKQLEMWMGMKNVRDLPFPVGTVLTHEQMDILGEYNEHDVVATIMFFVRSLGMIELRDKMGEMFNKDFTNCSDVKMGELILIHELQKRGVKLTEKVNGRTKKLQTFRDSIKLNDVIFPYIKLETPEFQELEKIIRSRTIVKVEEELKTKGLLKGAVATLHGVEYKIGTGGIHASVHACEVFSDDDYQIIDIDVAGFYPDIAKQNKMHPKHLGENFVPAYAAISDERSKYPKKTHPMENGAYKLASNGAYGNSNSKYSSMYDPFYTMQTTINGQLMLCMLVEQMVKIPGLKMIQANTDGITYKCPRVHIDQTRAVCKWWEGFTCLTLEEALYKSMHIRDVNNYIAVYDNGDVKRIGCYAHETAEQNPGTRELPWNKNWSERVVQLAAEHAIVNRGDIGEFIRNHKEPKDFMILGKIPRASNLVARYVDFDVDVELPNVIRYYVSKDGPELFKLSPPKGEHGTWKVKNKPKNFATKETWEAHVKAIQESEERLPGEVVYTEEYNEPAPRRALGYRVIPETFMIGDVKTDINGVPHNPEIHSKVGSYHMLRTMAMNKGNKCTDCSDIKEFNFDDVNYDYYIEQCKKIVDPLLTGESL